MLDNKFDTDKPCPRLLYNPDLQVSISEIGVKSLDRLSSNTYNRDSIGSIIDRINQYVVIADSDYVYNVSRGEFGFRDKLIESISGWIIKALEVDVGSAKYSPEYSYKTILSMIKKYPGYITVTDGPLPLYCLRGVYGMQSSTQTATYYIYSNPFTAFEMGPVEYDFALYKFEDMSYDRIELDGFSKLNDYLISDPTNETARLSKPFKYLISDGQMKDLKVFPSRYLAKADSIIKTFGIRNGFYHNSDSLRPLFNLKPKVPVGVKPQSFEDIKIAEPYFTHLANICNFKGDLFDINAEDEHSTSKNAKEAYWELLGMIAYRLQNPDGETSKGLFITGPSNCGKGIIFTVIQYMLEMRQNTDGLAPSFNLDALTDSKNQSFEDPLLFIMINELPEHLNDETIESLKNILDQTIVTVNPKFRKKYNAIDTSTKIIFSNHKPPAFRNITKKRLLMIECQMTSAEIDISYKVGALRNLIEKIEDREWLRKLLGVFQSRKFFAYDDYLKFHPREIPVATDCSDMIFENMSDEALRVIDFMRGVEAVRTDKQGVVRKYPMIDGNIVIEGQYLRREYNSLFNRDNKKFGSKLWNDINRDARFWYAGEVRITKGSDAKQLSDIGAKTSLIVKPLLITGLDQLDMATVKILAKRCSRYNIDRSDYNRFGVYIFLMAYYNVLMISRDDSFKGMELLRQYKYLFIDEDHPLPQDVCDIIDDKFIRGLPLYNLIASDLLVD